MKQRNLIRKRGHTAATGVPDGVPSNDRWEWIGIYPTDTDLQQLCTELAEEMEHDRTPYERTVFTWIRNNTRYTSPTRFKNIVTEVTIIEEQWKKGHVHSHQEHRRRITSSRHVEL